MRKPNPNSKPRGPGAPRQPWNDCQIAAIFPVGLADAIRALALHRRTTTSALVRGVMGDYVNQHLDEIHTDEFITHRPDRP